MTPPIAGFLRVGHTAHQKLLDLHAADRLPYRRFVFDAAHINQQMDLVRALKASGYEIVLDPNFAEMATLGRFGSSAIQKLTWANFDRPWQPSDFDRRRNHDVSKAIAQFAVTAGVHAVLAPTHLIEDVNDPWIRTDLEMCEAIREELDCCGGSDIAVDYQLITSTALLKDPIASASIASGIEKMPIENIWLRASGFGATATGAGTRHFIESVRGLHTTDRPVIADMAGGFSALGAAAFGAVAGICHGIGQKESFKAADWRSPPFSRGGSSVRVYVHELDRFFKEDQLLAIFEAKGGRSRFSCPDTSCCPHGGEDMIENSHVHFLTQRHRQLVDLSGVPEARRASHFLLRHLDPAIFAARHGTKLKIADGQVLTAVRQAKVRIMRLRDVLADLDAKGNGESRSRIPNFRGSTKAVSAVLGR
jgi:hypothetical protein